MNVIIRCSRLVVAVSLGWGGVSTGWASDEGPPVPGITAPLVFAAGDVSTHLGPRISFATNVYDFGKVTATETVKFDFVFTNIGNQTLVISNVMPGCSSCTVAGKWDKRVEPGKTGVIPVQFKPTAFEGNVAKSVTVICNDPHQFAVKLQLKGTVWVPIEVKPKAVVINVTPDNPTNLQRVVRILNHEDQPLKLSDPQCTNRVFQTELRTIRPEQEFELSVRVVPPGVFGTFQVPIKIATSSKLAPEVSVSAVAIVPPPVLVMPQQIALPPKPLPAASSYKVFIRNSSGGTNLVVSSPTLELKGVEVQLEESQPGRLFIVTLTFPVGFEVQASGPAELRLTCNHPQFPVIRVPILPYRGFTGTAGAPRAMAPSPAPGSVSTAPAVTPPKPQ
jgi:hypothetical protein